MKVESAIILLCIFFMGVSAEEILMPGELWESGYITVRGTGNELFYYLVRSRDRSPSAPLVIWLNGGPGCSSAYGLFTELGPYMVNRTDNKFWKNEWSWNNKYDMLFVDQPVQVGFSLVKDDDSLCINQTCVVNDFYTFLLKFVEKYPQYYGRPLYVSGESYGGHYVPSISARLARVQNPALNLKGVVVGNPFTSMSAQMGAYPYYLYENKNFSTIEYVLAKAAMVTCQIGHLVGLEKVLLTQICDFSLAHLQNLPNGYDIREKADYDDTTLIKTLNDTAVREMLGVKKKKMSLCNDTIYNLFSVDLATSVSFEIEYLISHKIDVMLYFGNKDFMCNWRGGEALVNSFQWYGNEGFSKLDLKEWFIGKKAVGKYKKYEYLNFLMVYDAGHLVPMDQPEAAYEMITRFINKSY